MFQNLAILAYIKTVEVKQETVIWSQPVLQLTKITVKVTYHNVKGKPGQPNQVYEDLPPPGGQEAAQPGQALAGQAVAGQGEHTGLCTATLPVGQVPPAQAAPPGLHAQAGDLHVVLGACPT